MTKETNMSEWASLVYQPSQKREIPPEVRKRVLRRDKWRCVHCRTRKKLTIHHIMPHCEGGGLDIQNLVTLWIDCHDEIEPLGLRSRTLIENWEAEGDIIKHKDTASDPVDWHAWVYGGYARPRLELEEAADKRFVPVSEVVWLKMIEEME